MKAVQIIRPGEVTLVHLPLPAAGPGEVLIKINCVGFCGSDLNTYLGKNPMVQLPVVPGHEISAEIAKTSAGVPEHLRPGTPCTVNPYTACGHCPACLNSRPNACRFNRTLGVQRDGAMAEFMTVPWEKIIPDRERTLSKKALALVEPLSVGFHAVARAQVTDSDTVAVIGCGMVGLGALIRSAIRGAKVIAVDVDDDKLALARRLGAACTIHSKTENVQARLQDITGGAGPDVVVEAAGRPETYRMAIDGVAFTGRVVCIGYAGTEIAFETKLFVQKEMDIRGSRNALPEDFRAVMDCLRRGLCPEDALISGIYPPEHAREALEKWKSGPGKVFRILVNFE
ncbi:MAG: zinc-binding alcohol dehydrogenase family protein [Tannerella sp.]|jgi:threonine dehydrogenase-like Zn-dependent dehydrogenase|nr:zinc-binding alcohol dehydrogenase family protein [Tannerella sp.]